MADNVTGPAGERLEPVEGGPSGAGEYYVTGRVRIDDAGWILDARSDHRAPVDEAFMDATWQRVVKDPPLPKTPGRVIRALAGSDLPRVYVSEIDEVNGLIWVGTHSRGYLPGDITRVLYVYPEPGEEQQ